MAARRGTRAHSRRRTTTTRTKTRTRWKRRMEAPGGEEEWRHGNSGLALDVLYGRSYRARERISAREAGGARSGFKEDPA